MVPVERGPKFWLAAPPLVIAALLAFVGVIVFLPQWIVRLDGAGSVTGGDIDLAAVGAARTSVLQTVAGAAVLLGALATWRRLALNADELRATREGQVTDQFIRAVDQLVRQPHLLTVS